MENKISKTLVDTLIDLQLDDAPLLVKKSQGSDKCASCNQHIPLISSNNIINHHNHLTNNCSALSNSDRNEKLANSTNITKKFQTNSFFDNEDGRIAGKNIHKANESMNSFHLPELSHSGSKSNFKFKKSIHQKEIQEKNVNKLKKNNSNLNMSQPPMNYDEFSEKRLNNMISSELEKKIINPGDIMKATKKIYENIDKKHKEK